MPHIEKGPYFPLYVNDDGTIGKEYKYKGGGSFRVNDARYIDTFERSERKFNEQCEAYHRKLLEKGVKAYRCNDGLVDRKRCKVTFFDSEQREGYYLANMYLDVGDKIFIGSVHDGGRFAEITRCEDYDFYSRSYFYKPLEETFEGWDLIDGTPFPFITEKNAPKLSFWDKLLGKKMPRQRKDIYEEWPVCQEQEEMGEDLEDWPW